MTAYYNEIDPYAAEWLRNLIKEGHIADGVVDTRSIEDVLPSDLRDFTQCHFFAGIGVWSYALRLGGWHDDRPVWTGSCPCQPFSAAGKGGGFTDERHLWPSWFHLIEQCRPSVVYGEQVADRGGLAWLDLVSTDMENADYAFGAVDTCSAGFGAPHRRQRLRFVAMDNAEHARLERHAWNGRSVTGWPSTARPVASSGAFSIVADDNGMRLEQIAAPGFRADAEHDAQSCGGAGGMDNAERDGWGTGRDDHTGHDRQQSYSIDLFGGMGNTHGERKNQIGSVFHGSQSKSDRGGALGGLADDPKPGRFPWGRIGEQGGRRDETRVEPRRLCHACGLADATDIGRNVGTGFCNCRSPGLGRDVIADSGATLERPRPTNGFWRAADWLLCRDPSGPKWRPVEPGTFPLAHGAPARVGRLRAYGNAVDAQATKAFIDATIDL